MLVQSTAAEAVVLATFILHYFIRKIESKTVYMWIRWIRKVLMRAQLYLALGEVKLLPDILES